MKSLGKMKKKKSALYQFKEIHTENCDRLMDHEDSNCILNVGAQLIQILHLVGKSIILISVLSHTTSCCSSTIIFSLVFLFGKFCYHFLQCFGTINNRDKALLSPSTWAHNLPESLKVITSVKNYSTFLCLLRIKTHNLTIF